MVTLSDEQSSRLSGLYNQISKHANYQSLPEELKTIVKLCPSPKCQRYERERLDYITRKLGTRIKNAHIVDIGGNTGFFSFELLKIGAAKVSYFEGNLAHAHFVREATMVLNLERQLQINAKYFDFANESKHETADIILLLNLLHHIGDDFGENIFSKDMALQKIFHIIRKLAYKTKILVLQLGFNWKGDRSLPLFSEGSKKNVIDFVNACAKFTWDVIAIGVPVLDGQRISYNELDAINIRRDDALGEFLNRPIFIMQSIICNIKKDFHQNIKRH